MKFTQFFFHSDHYCYSLCMVDTVHACIVCKLCFKCKLTRQKQIISTEIIGIWCAQNITELNETTIPITIHTVNVNNRTMTVTATATTAKRKAEHRTNWLYQMTTTTLPQINNDLCKCVCTCFYSAHTVRPLNVCGVCTHHLNACKLGMDLALAQPNIVYYPVWVCVPLAFLSLHLVHMRNCVLNSNSSARFLSLFGRYILFSSFHFSFTFYIFVIQTCSFSRSDSLSFSIWLLLCLVE